MCFSHAIQFWKAEITILFYCIDHIWQGEQGHYRFDGLKPIIIALSESHILKTLLSKESEVYSNSSRLFLVPKILWNCPTVTLSRWCSFRSCALLKMYLQDGEQKIKTSLQIKTWGKIWGKREHLKEGGWRHVSHGQAKGLMVLKGDDDTQSPGVPANTNPTPNQTVPHNPLLQAG